MGDIVDLDPAGARLAFRLTALARDARHEVLALHPDVIGVETLVTRIDEAAGRATVRHIVPESIAAGPDARIRSAVAPAGLFVFDRALALVFTLDVAEYVVLTDRGSVALMCALFERVWSDSLPAACLTDQQSEAVRLLADGHTDDAIAKRLGVSPRTARRIVTRLMARLGARGRFQAGVRAVEAGWLTTSRSAEPCFDVRTTG